jgi:glucokinase
MSEEWRLLADIGGTNARFALQRPGGPAERIAVLPSHDYDGLAAAAAAYLKQLGDAPPIARAAVCVAGPVIGDHLALTNAPWRFSIEETRRALGLAQLRVVNDFVAVALAVPHLDPSVLAQIGGRRAEGRAPIVVLGAGTGLGVCGLVPDPRGAGWLPVPGEGGHATLAGTSEREDAVFARIRARYGHCSGERVVSGSGLVNVYEAIAALDGRTVGPVEPADVTRMAAEGDPLADEAVEIFCCAAGTVAGNLALIFTALGGVYLAGGIIRLLGERFRRSRFRERLEAKGRFRDLLATVPAYQITEGFSAMIGLAALLDGEW